MSALSPTIHPAPCRARSAHTKLNVSLLGEVANAEMLQARIRRISYVPALSPLRPIHRRCTRGLAARTRRARTHPPAGIILLLGTPLFRRSAVGGGQALLEETGDGASLRRTLFFAA